MMDLESASKDFTRSAEVGQSGTIFARKRQRRVSFADTTAIHFFHRDEDVDTPPDARVLADSSSLIGSGNDQLGSRRDTNHEEDRKKDDDDDADDDECSEEHEFFVRREADSSSPCSTTGSVASVDDDDLFGPVSTSFIRSGGLSEAADDSNHDITLDSTAFSMHFNKIIPSDDRTINSFRSPRTPTGASMTNDSGGFLPRNNSEKMAPHFELQKANGYSSDFTVVAERSSNYDYRKLSLTLEGLYAEAIEPIEPQPPDLKEKSSSAHKHHDAMCHGEIVACESTGIVEVGQEDGKLRKEDIERVNVDLHVSTGFHTPLAALPSVQCRSERSSAPNGETNHESQFSTNKDVGDGSHKPKLPSYLSDDTSKTKAVPSPSVKSPKSSASGSRFLDGSHERVQHSKVSMAVTSDSPYQMPGSSNKRLYTPTKYEPMNCSTNTPETSISSVRARARQLLHDAKQSLESGHQSRMSLKRKVIPHIEGTSLIKNCMVEFETSEKDARDHHLHLLKPVLLGDECRGSTNHLDFSTNMEVNDVISVKKYMTPDNLSSQTDERENVVSIGGVDQAVEMVQVFESGSTEKIDKSLSTGNLTPKTAFSPASGYSNKVHEKSHSIRSVRKLFPSSKSVLRQNLSAQKEEQFTHPVNEPVNSNTIKNELKSETPMSHFRENPSTMKKVNDTMKEISISGITSFPDNQDRSHQSRKDIDCNLKPLADQSHIFSFSSPGVQEKATTSNQHEDGTQNGHVTENNTPSYHLRTNISEGVASPFTLSSSQENSEQDPATVSDILGRVLEKTRHVFSEFANKLNLHEIDALEDLTCELKNARKYESLCSHIQTLGKNTNQNEQKRLSEIRGIKETLLYEQAILQLRRSKHGRLLRKVQELKLRTQEITKLKESFMKLKEKQSNLIPVVTQEEYDRVGPKREELVQMEEKIKTLVALFAARYNMTGTPGPEKVIKVVRNHFSELDDLRGAWEHLQLWKLASVINQTDQCDIILNYRDFLCHRFTITFTPASRFGAELSINDSLVDKHFPNMRASTAFHFVLNGLKGNRRLTGVRCFQSETQACTFLLGNVLEVLQEMQSAQLQVPSLTSSFFSLTSDGKLELELHFIDWKTGRKLELAVDLTHLNCAVYPSEPSELVISCSPQKSTEKVNASVRSLTAGRSTLLRLCCRISQLLQASSLSS